jgi:DNA-binding MarR family transcriptional regulator
LAKFGVLAQLDEHGGKLPLRTLADNLECVRSNVTQMIDRLEADGLARRVNDPADRRSILAEITSEGRRRCRAAKQAFRRAEEELVATLGGNEQAEAFQRILQRL